MAMMTWAASGQQTAWLSISSRSVDELTGGEDLGHTGQLAGSSPWWFAGDLCGCSRPDLRGGLMVSRFYLQSGQDRVIRLIEQTILSALLVSI